jgi:ribonuclease HII
MTLTTFPHFLHETLIGGLVAGVDEAGRGPIAGPVVAAAVILNPAKIPAGIQDSKKLSHIKREALFEEICTHAIAYGIAEASVEEIDRINILQASLLAMERAAEKLSPAPKHALIDGNKLPKNLPCPATAIVKGDSISFSIAAASILAKVTRDRLMAQLAEQYTQYGWAENAGYPTPDHLARLEKFGASPHHRKSFAPVKKVMQNHG